MFENPDPDQLCAMLKEVRTIAVIGLSPRPERPSYYVAQALQRFGFRIIPVRPAISEVLGEKAYPTLADVPEKIDLVNVFRTQEYIDAIVDDCLKLGIKRLWIQQGIINEAAALRARENGMTVVMDRCIMVEYRSHCL